jgi:hypothetical protein
MVRRNASHPTQQIRVLLYLCIPTHMPALYSPARQRGHIHSPFGILNGHHRRAAPGDTQRCRPMHALFSPSSLRHPLHEGASALFRALTACRSMRDPTRAGFSAKSRYLQFIHSARWRSLYFLHGISPKFNRPFTTTELKRSTTFSWTKSSLPFDLIR